MFRFFKGDFFNFEALRLVSFAPYDGAEIGEVLVAIGEIKENDVESWYRAWMKAGEKAEIIAGEAELAGNQVAAKRAYFRASNYQRSAQFMLNGSSSDPRVLRVSEDSISNFRRAQQLMDEQVFYLEIPYAPGIDLPAYLYLPQPSKRLPGKIPLLLNTVGGDATQEEIFYIFPYGALENGYAALTFDGPGQGMVLRKDKLPMRPDWEFVISKVLDWLYKYNDEHPEFELDLDRLALAGCSIGGYLSLRGAADSRVKACVAIDPFFSMWDLVKGRMPHMFITTFEAGGFAPDHLWDYAVSVFSWLNAQTKWEFTHMKWIFGVDTAAEVFRSMMRYTFANEDETIFLDKVKCPVMVTGAAASIYAAPEVGTWRVYNCLDHIPEEQKMTWIATDLGEGGLQAKVGSFGILNQKTFAWLDKMFKIDRKICGKI